MSVTYPPCKKHGIDYDDYGRCAGCRRDFHNSALDTVVDLLKAKWNQACKEAEHTEDCTRMVEILRTKQELDALRA